MQSLEDPRSLVFSVFAASSRLLCLGEAAEHSKAALETSDLSLILTGLT